VGRALGNGYVEIFRNIPLIVQMFLWFFVFPELLPKDWATRSSRCRRRGALRSGGAVPGHLHLGARGRAGARRHQLAAARPAHGRHRHGPDQRQTYAT
jgi:hypothetical protein